MSILLAQLPWLLKGLLVFFAVGLVLAVTAVVCFAWRLRGPKDTALAAFLRLVNLVYARLFHRFKPPRLDPFPASGPVLLVANHRSSVDPVILAACTRRTIRFLMAREYYDLPWLRWFFDVTGAIPVKRDGRDIGPTITAIKALRGGDVVGIFPQGGIRGAADGGEASRLEGTAAADELKSGAALLALKTGAPVVVAYLEGTPTASSVFQAFRTRSRSQVRFSKLLRFQSVGKRSPPREQLREVITRISDELEALQSTGVKTPAGLE